MTNGELIRVLTRIVLTTSDDCANRLQQVFSKFGDGNYEKALEEYIYFKMYIAAQLCYQAGGAPGDAEFLVSQTIKEVKHTLKVTGPKMNWGATPEGLERRFEYYKDMAPKGNLSSMASAFINVLDPMFIYMLRSVDDPQSVFEEFTQCAITDMRNKLIKKTSGGGGCYIATCVYGDYDCPSVWVLRRFRDNVLAECLLGRIFIKAYYFVSPKLVTWFGEYETVRKVWEYPLNKLVLSLKKRGFSDKPYEDKD